MPKSTRQVGIDFQRWVEVWIKKEYPDAAVHNFKPTSKKIVIRDKKTGQLKDIWISQDNDLWNCIDLEIKMKHCPKPIYIQATTGGDVGRKLEKMAHVPWDFDHQIVQLFQKKEPGRIVIQQLRDNKKLKCYEFYKIAEIIRGKYVPETPGNLWGEKLPEIFTAF